MIAAFINRWTIGAYLRLGIFQKSKSCAIYDQIIQNFIEILKQKYIFLGYLLYIINMNRNVIRSCRFDRLSINCVFRYYFNAFLSVKPKKDIRF